jgi:hypothetical protein
MTVLIQFLDDHQASSLKPSRSSSIRVEVLVFAQSFIHSAIGVTWMGLVISASFSWTLVAISGAQKGSACMLVSMTHFKNQSLCIRLSIEDRAVRCLISPFSSRLHLKDVGKPQLKSQPPLCSRPLQSTGRRWSQWLCVCRLMLLVSGAQRLTY